MYIGEVSKRTGLSIKTIRFYEEKGLIRVPKRKGAYRVYTSEDIEILKLIVEAKALGVTLSELKGVICYKKGGVNWSEIGDFLTHLKLRIEHDLKTMAENLKRVDACIHSLSSCPKSVDSPL